MIKDKIQNHNIYRCLGVKFAKAFDFIIETDLAKIPTGKYEIEGEDVFAIIMEYQTKRISKNRLEAHKKYIDLQYIIHGNELIGISSLKDESPFEVNNEKDYSLYQTECDLINFNEGTFMIFYPEDIHMPGISVNKDSIVKKIVIKISI